MNAAPQPPHGRTLALVMLTLVCVFWGSTFPLMKDSYALIGEHAGEKGRDIAPMAFLALRFVLATLLMPLAFLPLLLRGKAKPSDQSAPHVGHQAPRKSRRGLYKLSLALGVLFTGAFYLQVYGLRDTTPAISAFLTSLYVIFTPAIVLSLGRQLPGWRVMISTLIALTGVAFIAYEPDISFQSLIGDWGVMLSLACAVGFAGHIVLTDYATKREDPALLSLLMMVVASVIGIAVLGVAVGPTEMLRLCWAMLGDWGVMWRMLIMVVFATTFAVYAWNRWQKDLGPTRASVLYTLEPVFATIFSVMIALDHLRWQLFVGGGMIIAANLLCELAAALKKKKPQVANA
ncbi:MAG: DMT family transporter [Planctomycetes bacterium]|nr:DMT family transporter [Planctomycetota bacterium]